MATAPQAVNGQAYARFMARPMHDSLANMMTGSGTTVDRRMHNRWLANVLVQQEIEDAYRGSWLMRKIIDLPAEDMTKAWRDWQADCDQIELLEAEEKRLHVRKRIKQGLIMGRLGGGILIMGFGDDPGGPLDLETVDKEGLQYLYPVSRWNLKVGDPINEPTDPNFGEPETFEFRLKGRDITVHHSRCIIFKGLFSGHVSQAGAVGRSDFWGDSVVTVVDEAVKNATTVHNEFASLVSEAKVDVLKIPDLMLNAGNAEYEKKFLRRVDLANVAKSIHRMLIIDAGEEWEQRQLNLTGMAELTAVYMTIVAGAADIPATRLLGKSPDGMNATGESDQDNYNQMIRTKQENELRPLMDKLDEPLIRSTFGDRPKEIHFAWAPLDVPDEQEQAETENKEADTLERMVNTGLFQPEALEKAFSNRMIESGRWPGYEKAREKALREAAENPTPDDVEGVTQPGRPGQSAIVGNGSGRGPQRPSAPTPA